MTDTAAKRFSAVNVSCPWRGLGYFPTGTVDAAERLAVAYLYSGIAAEAPVEVPDVVGETQAAGTSTLEGEGFVVAVQEDYSDLAAGLIFAQSPVGGSFVANGSTVTIYVSLGPRPQQVGGRSKRKSRRRLFVEIDGQDFEVSDAAEAESLLRKALSTAEAIAKGSTARNAKRIKRGRKVITPGLPKIKSSPEIAPVVDEYRERINAVYRQIAIHAELRELMRLQLLEDDENDAITVLLLH